MNWYHESYFIYVEFLKSSIANRKQQFCSKEDSDCDMKKDDSGLECNDTNIDVIAYSDGDIYYWLFREVSFNIDRQK